MKSFRYFVSIITTTLCLLFLSTIIATAKHSSPVSAATAASHWIEAKRSGDIAYFLFENPIKIERFDIAAESWLTPVTFDSLLGVPTAFTVDADYLFVGFDRALYRFNLDGTGQLHLYNTDTAIKQLFSDTQYILINYSTGLYGKVASLNKKTGLFIDSDSFYIYAFNGGTYAPGIRKILGTTIGVSPSDIFQITVNNDGTFGAATDSPYHGSYPTGTSTFLFPNESRVVDSAGIIYNTSDLTYSNSLAGKVDDITFYGNLPIVLRNDTLIAYSSSMLETGNYTPQDHTPAKIYIKGDTIYSFFFEETRGVSFSTVDINFLSPDDPGEPVDPNGLFYKPDSVAMGNNEIVYMLSKSHLNIFRWSAATRSYLESIPLVSAPSYMAYSSMTNRIYLAYSSGQIGQIKLDESFDEVPFANLPSAPRGLATAGEYVFAADDSGAWHTHYTFHPDGTQISAVDWNYYSAEYIWSTPNRKMYFFQDGFSPNHLRWEDVAVDGALGAKQESSDSEGIFHPIRVAPDGSKVVLGSGRIYDAISLSHTDNLSNTIKDAAWWDNRLYTLRDVGVDIQVQKWNTTYGLEATATTPGEALRFYTVGEGLLAIIDFYGLPRFVLYDPMLTVLFASDTLSGLTAFNDSPTWLGHSTTFTSTVALGAGTLSYLWQFGDGASKSGSDVSHVYSSTGDFGATLTVHNEAQTISATTAVSVVPSAHGRVLVDKVTLPGGESQVFSFTFSGGPDALDEDFSLADTDDPWDSGDVKPGNYGVSETVPSDWAITGATCDDGSDPSNIQLSAGEMVTCTFTNTKVSLPIADFSASPTEGVPPVVITFTNLSTGDFDECVWDFGDGEKSMTCDNPKHEYKHEGQYTVLLTVRGSGGEDTMMVEKCIKVAYYRIFLPAAFHRK